MEKLVGGATWYVGMGEGNLYLGGRGSVIESGGLCESRNRALMDASVLGIPCVQLSDDLKKIEYLFEFEGKVEAKEITFEEAVGKMMEVDKIFRMIGVAPTGNPFFWDKKEYTTNKFIVGDFILVRPCGLFFDENLKLKEDYDYTLQHITTFGGVARYGSILAHFAHRTNAGGAVEYRDPEREQEMITYLKNKWGKFIRDNPRRPNEILLNL